MKITEIQNKIVTEQSALLIRPRKDSWQVGQPKEYDVKPLFTGNHKGWVILDLTTAHAMDVVFKALSQEAQSKWDIMPVNKLIDFCWAHVA